MKSLHRQRGMSLWGVVFLTALVLFTGLLLVKMSGVYYDHQTLNKTIRNALAGQTATGFSESEFFDRVAKNMQINGIRIDLKKELTYDKRQSPPVVVLNYEKREHLFLNVDVVMSFHQEYEL
ncbi:DUF4845 domain-containing protein [Reinekea forsetii]|jgi:hypothetical protein|uniref:DUF4845 domain-containing protein n=1 Tax=Reinekea forsetii TaxID=1336806 RepID=A0A2K8KRK3_9GAMM|nr:DUF4845 domain-containing protein [Reinekea forsetii]ATX77357.1 hypothetical protein REIFOR_02224 [Reinekea forsetii]